MRVLMFGWEFPPVYSGGLGTACFGLTKALANKGTQVTFVMPNGPMNLKGEYVKLLVANNLGYRNINIKRVNSLLTPYISSNEYEERYKNLFNKQGSQEKALYGAGLFDEVYRFGQMGAIFAETEEFDVIHCHDWMTFQAGITAKNISHKPLVVQVHATEFDRTGGNGVNQHVYNLERKGMEEADRVIAVSNHTKNTIIRHYGIPEHKVTVVHNAIEFYSKEQPSRIKMDPNEKVVLFLGRITLQKGPDYFIDAARKVLDIDPNVKFVIAGSGDMAAKMIEKAASMGMGKKVLFTGFLTGADVDKAYRMADVYVMPSVSEPFGLTPLEAIRNGTPVIISKQSGVSEVLRNCLKVDFWDIDELANKMIAALHYTSLHQHLQEQGFHEVHSMRWDVPADKCIAIYNELLCAPLVR